MSKRVRWRCLIVLTALVLLPSGTASAQSNGPSRGGFTLLLTLGVGFQNNEILDENEVGLGGLNLGIGGFVSPELAVMARFSGTNVSYQKTNTENISNDVVSGVFGVSAQYWTNDFFNVEIGAGYGSVIPEFGDDGTGFGLLFATGLSFYHRGKSSLQVGVEYAPVFIDKGNVHNICIAFGWQLL